MENKFNRAPNDLALAKFPNLHTWELHFLISQLLNDSLPAVTCTFAQTFCTSQSTDITLRQIFHIQYVDNRPHHSVDVLGPWHHFDCPR